jgi:hypothetical protein
VNQFLMIQFHFAFRIRFENPFVRSVGSHLK